MRCFVTGSNGFIGRHLVPRLREIADVIELQGDLLDPAALRPAAEADVVVHLAAQAAPLKGEADPVGMTRTNVVGTLGLAAATRRDARFVFASTAHVYAPATTPRAEDAPLAPISAYGASKLSAEFGLRALAGGGPRTVILRLFNVYGSGQPESTVVGRMLGALGRGETPVLGAPHPVRDFVHVDDVADAFVRAARSPARDLEVVNVGTGIGTSIRDLAAATGRTIRFAGGARPADTDHLVADITRARSVLGWEPRIPLAQGIKRSLAP